MFLEYAVWGAWAPVLAARLLGPLEDDRQANGVDLCDAPDRLHHLAAGRRMAGGPVGQNRWILIVAHFVGAVLLVPGREAESVQAAADRDVAVFVVLCGHAAAGQRCVVCGTANIADAREADTQGKVFIWAPVAWALIGWALTGWRMSRQDSGRRQRLPVLWRRPVRADGAGLFPAARRRRRPATGEIPILKTFGMSAIRTSCCSLSRAW